MLFHHSSVTTVVLVGLYRNYVAIVIELHNSNFLVNLMVTVTMSVIELQCA